MRTMSQLGYTQGSGAEIRTDQGSTSGAHMQVVKLAEGAAGSENLLPSTVANGLLVEVSKVDAAVSVTGEVSVTSSPGFTVEVASVTGTVTVAGDVSLTGTPAISGTVTAGQGAAASDANAWPVRLTDGTNEPHFTSVGGNYALDVNVAEMVTPAGVQADKTGFTEGSGMADVIAGVLNETISSDPGEDQAAAVRITPKRALHTHLRDQAGNALGTSSNALRIDPVGTTTQPVSGTVTAQVKDGSGTAFSIANPLPTQNQPSSNSWKAHVTFSASQTDQTIYSPPSGKTAYIEGITITPTAAGALLKIYDQTNADANAIYIGQPPVTVIVITPSRPIPLSAANNILRYATGASAAGDITAWGYYA